MILLPSILSADIGNLVADVKKIEEAGADGAHIDIMDGHFVPNLTFGVNVVSALRKATDFFLDCHMMVDNPDEYINPLKEAGANSMSIHYEAVTHLHRTIQRVKEANMKVGVAINPGTDTLLLRPVLNDLDYVLVMSVNPGFGGQKFLPSSVEKIKRLSDYRKEHNLSFKIQVDGGITDQTIGECLKAGAEIFVSGSYVYKAEDVKVPMESLREVEKRIIER